MGANANAVKELVVCGLLLSSRGILEGANHVKNVINVEENGEHEKIATRIEKDKAYFGGKEIQGKTIGVIGLGAIGSRVVDAALALPGDRMVRVTDLNDLFKVSDYISIHVPYIKGVTHHLIDAKALQICKPDVCILNFARGEIVDGEAIK